MNYEQEREKFNTILEQKTGNNYDIYADLCPFMGIVNDNHLNAGALNSASIYQTIFGLKQITDNTNKDDIAIQNRFLAVLYDYAENSRPDIWKKIPGLGILASGENEDESFLITSNVINGNAIFSFQRTLDEVSFVKGYNNGKLQGMYGISSNPNFEVVAEALDIADFLELIQENIPYNEKNIENVKKITLKNNDISPSF